MLESKGQQEDVIFGRADLIQAVKAGDTNQAKDILISAYLLFVNNIDKQAIKGQEPNLTGFSTELDKMFKELDGNKEAQQCLSRAIKKVVPTQRAHRQGAVRIFRDILDEVQHIKDMPVTGETTIGKLGLNLDTINKIIQGHSYTNDTTLGQLYQDREDMCYNEKSIFGKGIAHIRSRFKGDNPTPEDLKEFKNELTNLCILGRVQSSVQQQAQDQQDTAKREGLPDKYKEHLEEERRQSKLAKGAKKAISYIAGAAGVEAEADPKQKLNQNLEMDIASMSMNWDLQLHPPTEKHLKQIDYMQQRAKAAQGSRNTPETTADFFRKLWEFIKDFFENCFGKESTIIVNEIRQQHRDEMRVGRNVVKNLKSAITTADDAAQRVQTKLEEGIDRANNAAAR